MDRRPVQDRIEDLVAEEHRLWTEASEGRLTAEGHERLAALRGELDRCWDLLRRRRADPNAPETVPDVPDPPNDLEGPDPEPPHLEHGVRSAGPAPEPDPS